MMIFANSNGVEQIMWKKTQACTQMGGCEAGDEGRSQKYNVPVIKWVSPGDMDSMVTVRSNTAVHIRKSLRSLPNLKCTGATTKL